MPIRLLEPESVPELWMSLASEGFVLPATIVSNRVAVPTLARPPPNPADEFPLMVQSVKDAETLMYTPPPRSELLFPLMVQSVRDAVPRMARPPPYSAELLFTLQSVTVSCDESPLLRPPP